MISLFLKKQKSTKNKAEKGNKILNKTQNQVSNKVPTKRKAAIVAIMILLLSFGGSVQVNAASDAYAYELMDRVAAGSEYPSTQGLALGDGKAYVLKTNGEKGTECILFAGKKTNLKKIDDKLLLGHGNDMTYRRLDGKLYVAPGENKKETETQWKKNNYIYRMTTNGTIDAKIKTNYKVGSIACWLNYDKKNNKDAFVLKDISGLFHIVKINGTTLTELCQFNVNKAGSEKLNQGICMYDGYLYVTFWNNQNGNSYVYRVDKKMSTVLKESKTGTTKNYAKTRVVTLDKKNLLAAAGVSGKSIKVEIESIAFTGGYLYFTANANYEDKTGKSRSLDGLYKVTKQLA